MRVPAFMTMADKESDEEQIVNKTLGHCACLNYISVAKKQTHQLVAVEKRAAHTAKYLSTSRVYQYATCQLQVVPHGRAHILQIQAPS